MTDRVTIGSLVFEGDGSSDRIYARLRGWFGSPPMRADIVNRPNADGAFGLTRAYRGPRVITFEGYLCADTFAEAERNLWADWSGLQASGELIPFTVETDNGPLTSMVTLSGSADLEETGEYPNVASITAQFIAPDPVKYGPEVTYSTGLASGGGGLEYPLHDGGSGGALYYGAVGSLGRVEVVNEGTADTWPVFEVSGTLGDGFYIQCLGDGSILRYDRVVPAGTTVSIDSRTGQVLVDGVSDASTYLTQDEFFAVPAGGTCVVQFNAISTSSGTPTMTVRARSGWW